MDIIKITDKQYDAIIEWGEKNEELLADYLPYLMSGEVDIRIENDVNSYLIFDVNDVDGVYYVQISTFTGDEAKTEAKIKATLVIERKKHLYFTKFEMDKGLSYLDELTEDDIEEFKKSLTWGFLSVNAYFFHYKQDISILEKKEIKRRTVKVKGKYQYKSERRLNKYYTIINPIKTRKIPKSRAWRVECWGVVGHMRRLKNGKTVYVKPYVKGKSRENFTPNKLHYIGG